MHDWKIRFAEAVVIGCGLAILIGCGSSPSVSVTPSSAVLSPGQTFQFTVGVWATSTPPPFVVNGTPSGSNSSGTITAGGLYTAPSTPPAQPIMIGVQGQPNLATVTIFNPGSFTPGSFAATQNPLVASYSIALPVGASAYVQFGPDTTYGFNTSIAQAPSNGGNVTILVAGMRASTTYHMQAVIQLINGSQVMDADQTFTTGSIPANQVPGMTPQFSGGSAPSAGIELFSLIPAAPGSLLTTVATDLAGNIIWYYNLESTNDPFPIKPMPNGHMMLNVYPVAGSATPAPNEIREIDLAGNLINSIPLTSVNQSLASVASFQLAVMHHDFAILPNGHLILLGNYTQTINNTPGVPAGTVMTGDALVDWDPQRGAVWTWSTFDHLDPAHAPFGFTDWTHSNAIIYSPDDGNLILSMRNQNWIIKINYQNGAGDGSILWRFGDGGDFVLPGQQSPIEWNYGQHYPTIVSPNSSGVFSLMFFNNGNNRLVDSNNDICGSPGMSPCYSSVPMFQIDEASKTATVMWEDNLLPYYSICCGDALVLPNGDTEFDVAADVNSPGVSHIEEVTPTQELVWKMDVSGILAYRGFRIPSLYPGQVWPAATAQAMHAPHRATSANHGPALTVEQLP